MTHLARAPTSTTLRFHVALRSQMTPEWSTRTGNDGRLYVATSIRLEAGFHAMVAKLRFVGATGVALLNLLCSLTRTK